MEYEQYIYCYPMDITGGSNVYFSFSRFFLMVESKKL